MITMLYEGTEISHPDIELLGEQDGVKLFQIQEGNLAGVIFGFKPEDFIISEETDETFNLEFDITVAESLTEDQLTELNEVVNNFVIVAIGAIGGISEDKNYQ